MTGDLVPPESQSKPLCRSLTTAGKPCRGRPVADGLCRVHAGLVDVREAGRKGGKARGRKRAGSFRQAVADVLGRDPEKHAERLLSAGAAGYKLASELLEAEERREERGSGPIVDAGGRPVVGWIDVICLAIDTGQAALALGFEPTADQIAAVRAARDRVYVEPRGVELERGEAEGSPESVGVPVRQPAP